MFWCDTVSWIVKDTTLHDTAKGSCQTVARHAAKDTGIVCDVWQNTQDVCRNRFHWAVTRTGIAATRVWVMPISTVVADRGYDSESNHVITESIGIPHTIIRPKHETLPVYKTRGYHRKNMKRRFDWDTYHHRNKTETIFSVIKRMLGEYVMSRHIITQNREVMYRVIAYNCYRITRNNLVILGWFLHGLVSSSNL